MDSSGYLYPVDTNAPPEPLYGDPKEGEPLQASQVAALIQKEVD